MNERKLFTAVGFVVLAACFAYAGNADYKEAQAQHAHQCDMIAKGYWPAEFNPHCEAE